MLPLRGSHWIDSFHECRSVLRSSTFVSGRSSGRLGAGQRSRNLLFLDGEDHRVMRRLIVGGLPSVSEVTPTVRAQIERVVNRLPLLPTTDLVSTLSVPVAVKMTETLLGLSADEAMMVLPILQNASVFLDPLSSRTHGETSNSSTWLDGVLMFRRLLRKSDVDEHGAISRLRSQVEEGCISEPDGAINAFMLAHASFENSRNLLSLASKELLEGPTLRDLMRSNSGEWVEGVIRRASPARVLARTAREDSVVGDKPVRAGEIALLAIGEANRRVPTALQSSLQLKGRVSHLAFGAGVHACPGAAYVRLELESTMNALAIRIGDLSFRTIANWNEGLFFRGPSSLMLGRLM